MNRDEIAKYIEATILDPTASETDVEGLCLEALKAGFFGVCVAPCRAGAAVQFLGSHEVRVVSVAGFPSGTHTFTAKAAEAAELVQLGVDEVDAVINYGFVLESNWDAVRAEIKALRKACGDATLKVILETGALPVRALAKACEICVGEGADFLKTSTGFGPRGASPQDVHFLKKAAGGKCGVKAAGGIRDLDTALAMIQAGADRIGTSAGMKIWEAAGAT